MPYAHLIHFGIFPYCLPEEEWTKLLELSPLFQMLKELQLLLLGGRAKGGAEGAGKPTSTACRKMLLGAFLCSGFMKIRALFALCR